MLKQRATSAVVVVLVTVVPAFIGGIPFAVVIGVLAVLATSEVLRALCIGGFRPFQRLGMVFAAAGIAAAAVDRSPAVIGGILTAAILVTLAAGLTRESQDGLVGDWATTVAGTAYVALPLAHVVALRQMAGSSTAGWVETVTSRLGSGGTGLGLAWLGLAISATWLTDTAAYLLGRRFGRTKLIPRVSPGKTRVGAACGVVTGGAAGALAAVVFGVPIPWYLATGVGVAVAVVGEVGDLGESLIKRSVGIKDMGTLIPGHGGILDRIDALLFTVPVTYYLARLLQEVRWP